MRLAVLGSGGIGGYYGALLAKGGHDVAFIARGAHLEALQQRGFTVRTPEGESTMPVTAVAETKSLAPVDLVLFCVKSYDTAPAAQTLPPLMTRDTAVVTLQNGVDNAEAISRPQRLSHTPPALSNAGLEKPIGARLKRRSNVNKHVTTIADSWLKCGGGA